MQIYFRELKSSSKSMFFWVLGISLFTWMAISEFSAYYNNPEMADILASMPPQLMEAFSMSSVNLTTLTGFTSILTTYFAIILCVQAALVGSSILVKEEKEKTAEFLYVLPVTRGKVIIQKLIAGITQCAVVLFLSIISLFLLSMKYNPDESFIDFIILSTKSIFIMQVLFFAIGVLISALLKQYKKANGVTIGLVLGLYIMSVLQGLNENLDFLKYLTPFKYFEPNTLINDGELLFQNVLICTILIALSLITTIIIYPKKDLQI